MNQVMDEMQKIRMNIENLGYSVNARNEFYSFLDAIDSNDKLIKECQKIYRLLDEIVLDKEKNQFFTEVKKGTELFRARIIEPEDDNNPDSGVGKTKKGLFSGYNEVNSREPLVGISGNGRNNIAGASYLLLRRLYIVNVLRRINVHLQGGRLSCSECYSD